MGAECPYAFINGEKMAKITERQIDSINAMCRNGFSFDRYDFAVFGEKRLSKTIMLVENEKAVQIKIGWQEEVVKRTDGYGCTMQTYTGNVVPQLHCSVWHKSAGESCWHSYGLGKFRTFPDKIFPKRLMNRLCELTELVTDKLICEMLPEYEREGFQQKTGPVRKKT